MTEPTEFSSAMDPPPASPGSSPYNRIKDKVKRKVGKELDKMTRELQEELDDNRKHVDNVRGVAHDLVEPETLQRLRDIIVEEPEIQPGIDWWLWYHIVRKTQTWIIMKFVDIGTDAAAAYQHFKRGDLKYGFMTLFFVYLPGLVLSAGFTFWGLSQKREGSPPRRKEITVARLGKYAACLVIFPFLYPLVQILLGILLVGLLIRRRDHEPLKFMGHDLKQFKSMEGFLESGPQFTLQSYILMIGERKDTNDVDWANITWNNDAQRLATLSFSILMSYLSLVKTAYSVNVPDPDPRRKQQQDKKSSKWRFKITNCLFNATCVLFRLTALAYFFVYLRQYTVIIITTAFISNAIVMHCIGASPTILFFLGAISIFVPNGYLLYNFAGTFPVDFSRRGSQVLFLSSSLVVNTIWMAGIAAVLVLAEKSLLPKEQILGDVDQYEFVVVMTVSLVMVGLLSSLLALLHWFLSVEKLFEPVAEEEEEEEKEEEVPYMDEEEEQAAEDTHV